MARENLAEQSKDLADCLRLEGLPCKWFALRGSGSEMPHEDVLRAVFERFGKIKNIDIPMLDPYREELVGGSGRNFPPRGLRTFEAFIQYQESTSSSKAVETLKGMKLMFKGDDEKALACNIKVTSDPTGHFSEAAVNQRNLERLRLQGLEEERRREENRGKSGTDRKRRDDDDDDENKVGEGKRKPKSKGRGKRQTDRDDKRPRKQPKVIAGEELWPENMPEWEERKCLLAQRRAESVRLLTVLLNQIKNVVLSSRQTREPLVDFENERGDSFPASQEQNALKEKEKPSSLRRQELIDEKGPKYPLVQLDNVHISEREEEQPVGGNLPTSPRPLVRTILNSPVLRTITNRVTETKAIGRFCASGLLRVTVTQDCQALKPPNAADYPQQHLGKAEKRTRQKVYETEEFIHYLLNYHRTPRYARICAALPDPAARSWRERIVSRNGKHVQVRLRSRDGGQRLNETGPAAPGGHERDGFRWSGRYAWEEGTEKEATEAAPKSWAGTSKLAKSYRVWSGDPLDDTHAPIVVSTNTYHKKCQGRDAGVAVVSPHKPFGCVYKLKDLLEEISSDSECFSEALNDARNRTERRNGSCRTRCNPWPLGKSGARELLVCVQNVACGGPGGQRGKRSFCSNAECCDSIKRPRPRLKMGLKRPSGKIQHDGQQVQSSEEERESRRRSRRKKKKKKKRRTSSNSLPDDEADLFQTNHCEEAEPLDKMLHHRMKSKTLHAIGGVATAKDAIRLSASQLLEAQQEAGDLLLRRGEAEASSEGRPLLPVEIVQASPCPEAESGGGC